MATFTVNGYKFVEDGNGDVVSIEAVTASFYYNDYGFGGITDPLTPTENFSVVFTPADPEEFPQISFNDVFDGGGNLLSASDFLIDGVSASNFGNFEDAGDFIDIGSIAWTPVGGGEDQTTTILSFYDDSTSTDYVFAISGDPLPNLIGPGGSSDLSLLADFDDYSDGDGIFLSFPDAGDFEPDVDIEIDAVADSLFTQSNDDTVFVSEDFQWISTGAGNDTVFGQGFDVSPVLGEGDDLFDAQGAGFALSSYFLDGGLNGIIWTASSGNTQTITDTYGDTDTLIDITGVTGSNNADTIDLTNWDDPNRNPYLELAGGNDIVTVGPAGAFIQSGTGNKSIALAGIADFNGVTLQYGNFTTGLPSGVTVVIDRPTDVLTVTKNGGGGVDSFTGFKSLLDRDTEMEIRGTEVQDSFQIGDFPDNGIGGGALIIVSGKGVDSYEFTSGGSTKVLLDLSQNIFFEAAEQAVIANFNDTNESFDIDGDLSNEILAAETILNDGFGNQETITQSGLTDGYFGGYGLSEFNDIVFGSDGDETFFASAGDDVLHAGLGYDEINYRDNRVTNLIIDMRAGGVAGSGFNAQGNFELQDQFGNPIFPAFNHVLSGFEYIQGMRDANNDINGGNDGERIRARGDGDDILSGNGGDDQIEGENGYDTIFGGAGNDTLFGGDDGDNFQGNDGADEIHGGEGGDDFDSLDYEASGGTQAINANFQTGLINDDYGATDTVSGIEQVDATSNNDTIIGDSNLELINGNAGHDQITTNGSGYTLVSGGSGNDSITGSSSDDIYGDEGNDTLTASFDFAFIGMNPGLGEDEIDLTNLGNASTEIRWIDYDNGEGIVFSFDYDSDTATTDKSASNGGSDDTDTIIGLRNAIQDDGDGRVSLWGTQYADTFNLDLAGDFYEFDIISGGGNDIFNLSGGGRNGINLDLLNGNNFERATQGVVVDLRNNNNLFIQDGFGGTDTINSIDGAYFRGFLLTEFTDTFYGLDGDENINPLGGDDVIDGGGTVDTTTGSTSDFDQLRYDNSDVLGDIDVRMDLGTITGVWDANQNGVEDGGEAFTHTVSNIEYVRGARNGQTDYIGTAFNDRVDAGRNGNLNADGGAGDDTLSGRGDGDDTLIGGDGNDELQGNNGNDSLSPGSHSDFDYINPGRGQDTIDFTATSSGNYFDLDYIDMEGDPIHVTINQNTNTGTVDKGGVLPDQIIAINNALAVAELGISGSTGGDRYDITLTDPDARIQIRSGAGADVYNFSDTGFFSVRFDRNVRFSDEADEGVQIDLRLSDGQIKNDGFGFVDTIEGGDIDDFRLSEMGDRFDAKDGNDGQDDIIDGRGGNDSLFGYEGNDDLRGGDGDDSLEGGDGNDTLEGGFGNDVLKIGAGTDFQLLNPGDGNDTLNVAGAEGGFTEISYNFKDSDGNDFNGIAFSMDLDANTASTVKNGNATGLAGGNDSIEGISDVVEAGQFQIVGTSNNDTFNLNYGADKGDGEENGKVDIRSGFGNDTFNLSGYGGTYFDFSRAAQFEDLPIEAVIMDLGTGQVSQDGFGGSDTINDTSIGRTEFRLTQFSDSVDGSGKDERFEGLSQNDTLNGDAGNDTLIGGDGDDSLSGGAGFDYFEAGQGNDFVDGGTDFDFISYYWDIKNAQDNGDTIAGVGITVGDDTTNADDYLVSQDGFNTQDTLTAIEGIEGTNFADSISSEGDGLFMRGLGGNDTFDGTNGTEDFVAYNRSDNKGATPNQGANINFSTNTFVDNYGDNDSLIGIEGIWGSEFNDTIVGDNVIGRRLVGNEGDDAITGGSLADTLEGGADNDTLNGLGGDDELRDGAGNDSINGGDDNDTIYGEGGTDTYNGGAGTDTYIDDLLAQGITPQSFDVFMNFATNQHGSLAQAPGDWDTIFNVENYTLIGDFDVTVTGNGAVNVIETDLGADSVTGGGGGDTIRGGAGEDTLDGGVGNDEVNGGADADTVRGGIQNDTLFGGGGDDLLQGGDGADLLFGQAGADTLEGGENGDRYFVDAGDSVSDSGTLGFDTVVLNVASGISVTAGGWTGIEKINGNVGNDGVDASGLGTSVQIFGFAGEDTLVGGNGNDFLFGGTENDTLSAAAGNNFFVGGTGDDEYTGGSGDDTFFIDSSGDSVTSAGGGFDKLVIENASGVNLTIGGWTGLERVNGFSGADVVDASGLGTSIFMVGAGGNDQLTGGSANDIIIGGAGDDTLSAGTGGDNTLQGGTGDDDFVGAGGNDIFFISDDGDEVLDGGGGTDVAVIDNASGLTLSVGTWASVEEIRGFTGNDVIDATGLSTALTFSAGAGDDSLTGGSDNDTMYGGSGNDTLLGADGADVLISGNDADFLGGGLGNDYLAGGTGADVFDFEDNFGSDIVADFADGIDTLSFVNHTTVGGLGDLTFTQAGTTTEIGLLAGGTDLIRVLNTDVSDFDVSDFDFTV